MADLGSIRGLDKLVQQLRDRAARASTETRAEVTVGYNAAYAIWVHENLEMKHSGEPRPSGLGVYWGPSLTGPKFLENPARELRKELADIILQAVQNKVPLPKALLLAGLRLQADSQRRVPVEYGNLRGSAFTRLEEG